MSLVSALVCGLGLALLPGQCASATTSSKVASTTSKTTTTTAKSSTLTTTAASSSSEQGTTTKISSGAATTLVTSTASLSSSVSVTTKSSSTSLISSVSTASGSSTLSSTSASASANATAVGGQKVDQTILVLARSTAEAYSGYSGLVGYGIPYQVLIVPQSGASLPTLNSSASHGSYGGIVMISEVSYSYSSTNWSSALSPDQFNQLYSYQLAFGVRMVRIDVYPQPTFGTQTTIASTGCCDTGVEQLISFTNNTGFPTANLKLGATMSTASMYHYPASITDPSTTWQVAKFAPDSAGQFTSDSTAAVINNFGGRQQMVFFTSWATEWSPTSAFLQHAYIHWMTRGLFLGARKIYLSTQIDDVHLTTALYSPANAKFRIGPDDLTSHVSWTKSINGRLPSGSNYQIELGHNGNGDIINATNIEYSANVDICNPVDAVYPNDQPETALEFQKPLGTGADFWPTTPTAYSWSLACAQVDRLATWFTQSANRDAFAHISHTFTHLSLNNATFDDASREITFNQAWLKSMGISAGKFSANGLIPPAITGMHNGDVINAWMTNGITSVVGDNSRSVLTNQQNGWWPLISTVASNGYAGLTIIPRWPTTMYYNCDLPACTLQEWIDTSKGSGDFNSLLAYEKFTTSRYLLSLRQDPYMFHQANLRAADVPATTVGSVNAYSLLQIWVETVTQEMTRLTNWPIVTKKHDDIAQTFLQRMARDQCNPNLTYQYSSDGSSITGVVVTASGNSCSAPIPVTLPGTGTASSGTTNDQLGSEPLIMWVTLSGSPVTINLGSSVAI
ncbi:hypothetical protein LTR78_009003 [Recurvomyces mirabilis]|uniref:Extracellular serine-rich protein n=1 Tax=Recurvomyces mirabilis TaxID=574656 RepID=A0AAE0TP45_9PEZI|nr:hypothetical protein LTR78_009003 [Recurvomyces mirabilis]KAK5150469.1 hypothetical protein LTS14_010159 [Recurvomyces mirabilis]